MRKKKFSFFSCLRKVTITFVFYISYVCVSACVNVSSVNTPLQVVSFRIIVCVTCLVISPMGSFVLRVQGDSSTFVLNFANPVKSVSALLMATEISIIR